MRISDWSSDVCSSDLRRQERKILEDRTARTGNVREAETFDLAVGICIAAGIIDDRRRGVGRELHHAERQRRARIVVAGAAAGAEVGRAGVGVDQGVHPRSIIRSEEHTSELQSLMRISYAVFCLKKK